MLLLLDPSTRVNTNPQDPSESLGLCVESVEWRLYLETSCCGATEAGATLSVAQSPAGKPGTPARRMLAAF